MQERGLALKFKCIGILYTASFHAWLHTVVLRSEQDVADVEGALAYAEGETTMKIWNKDGMKRRLNKVKGTGMRILEKSCWTHNNCPYWHQ
jgi:hypothetical protein